MLKIWDHVVSARKVKFFSEPMNKFVAIVLQAELWAELDKLSVQICYHCSILILVMDQCDQVWQFSGFCAFFLPIYLLWLFLFFFLGGGTFSANFLFTGGNFFLRAYLLLVATLLSIGLFFIPTICNKCYERFTGLYLHVCKTGLFLKLIIALRLVKFNALMLVFTFNYQILEQKSLFILKYITLVATNDN